MTHGGSASAMICPHCGCAMNRHAEKLVLPTGATEWAAVDAALGGILEEHHTCPACGTGASRRRTPAT